MKILILFILLFIMESCNNKKVDVKKIDFSISNEKMKHSNDEEIFQKLLFNIDIVPFITYILTCSPLSK